MLMSRTFAITPVGLRRFSQTIVDFWFICFMAYQPSWVTLVWYSLVLWHINHCRLFNAKSSLYMYINIWFDLVRFHGISTIVGYLMPNRVITYVLDIYELLINICLLMNILKRAWAYFICTQLNCFNYFYLKTIFLYSGWLLQVLSAILLPGHELHSGKIPSSSIIPLCSG